MSRRSHLRIPVEAAETLRRIAEERQRRIGVQAAILIENASAYDLTEPHALAFVLPLRHPDEERRLIQVLSEYPDTAAILARRSVKEDKEEQHGSG